MEIQPFIRQSERGEEPSLSVKAGKPKHVIEMAKETFV